MRKLIFLILITLFAAYAGWAERRPVGHYLSDLRSQVSVVQGQPGERGNLLAVQPELFTPDYQSAERLQLKFHAYLENARRQGLLNERTVVVFPEHVGTWLVASGEKPEVYAAADWPTAMDWMAASNPLKVARGWITARGPTEQETRQTRRKRKAQGTTETKKAAIGRFLRGSPRLGVVKMYGAADGTRTRDPRRDRPVF